MTVANTALTWLSSPLSDLIARQAAEDTLFDVVVIGSGYGGSVR